MRYRVSIWFVAFIQCGYLSQSFFHRHLPVIFSLRTGGEKRPKKRDHVASLYNILLTGRNQPKKPRKFL
jgi:hypothetical protein